MSNSGYENRSRWINGLVQGSNNTVTNIFHTGFEALAGILKPFFRNFIPESLCSDSNLVHIQEQYSIEQEKIQIEQARLRHEISSTDKLLELHAIELDLQKREIDLKRWFFSEKLRLIQEYQASSIEIKLQEFQMNWDIQHSPFIISPQQAKDLFFKVNNRNKLWIFVAPPTVPYDPQEFGYLDIEIQHEIRRVITKYFSPSDVYPIEFYQIFSKSIKPSQASYTRSLLAPVPTLIFNTEITDRRVCITITCPIPPEVEEHNPCDNQVPLNAWDWEEIKRNLEQQGHDSKDSIRSIRELIIILHTVLAIYFSDLYCFNFDSYHNPRLFAFLQESEFPDVLQKWIEPYQLSLLQIQESIERERKLKAARVKSAYSTISFGNWGYGPVIAVGACLVLLLGFCSQMPSTTSPSNTDGETSVESNQGKSGTIRVDSRGVNLRATPNGQQIGLLHNGTRINVLELSSDGQWQRVVTEDGRSGWVWADFVQLDG